MRTPIRSTSDTMTIRLESAVKDRLDRLSAATHRSKSFLAAEAIREYVETNEWQIQEIHAALAEANAGDFATDAAVKAVLDKWNGHAD
jgi:RHH-type transcriptional regulator, rel operon repressor / antitoxin RelB